MEIFVSIYRCVCVCGRCTTLSYTTHHVVRVANYLFYFEKYIFNTNSHCHKIDNFWPFLNDRFLLPAWRVLRLLNSVRAFSQDGRSVGHYVSAVCKAVTLSHRIGIQNAQFTQPYLWTLFGIYNSQPHSFQQNHSRKNHQHVPLTHSHYSIRMRLS